jgi:hypothetical protein
MRNYHHMTPDEVAETLVTLNEKRKKVGLSCLESGKLDYCRNVSWDPDYYKPKKAK